MRYGWYDEISFLFYKPGTEMRKVDDSGVTRAGLAMEVEGVRPRGSPTLRYMDTIR